MTEHPTAAADEQPSDAATPLVLAALRAFSYQPRGPWQASDGEDLPIDLAEEFHVASRINEPFTAQALGPAGRELIVTPELSFALGRKALAAEGPGIALAPAPSLPTDLRDVVLRRRSALPPAPQPIGLPNLSTVLALSAGPAPDRPGLRVTPSGGALYPLDIFVMAHAVEGLARGSYLYDAVGHQLRPRADVEPTEFHRRVIEPMFAAPRVGPPQPAVTLAVVASFTRSRVKYGLRGYRFTLLEAGHIVQAAILASTALGIAALPWGGFIDDAADELLELDGLERSCIYLLGLAGPSGAECHV